MPVVWKHWTVTPMLFVVELGAFILFLHVLRTVVIYLGLVLSSPLVGCVAVAYDDKCFGGLHAWISGYGFRQIQLARGPSHVTAWPRYLGSASVELDWSSA